MVRSKRDYTSHPAYKARSRGSGAAHEGLFLHYAQDKGGHVEQGVQRHTLLPATSIPTAAGAGELCHEGPPPAATLNSAAPRQWPGTAHEGLLLHRA